MKFPYTAVLAGLVAARELPDVPNAGQASLPTTDLLALSGAARQPRPKHHLNVDLKSPKYHLSWCTEQYLWHIASLLTGYFHDDHNAKYNHCAYIKETESLFDWACLCKGGDGEGSAIIDMALLNGHVWDTCGWEYSFDVVFPETVNLCHMLLDEEAAAEKSGQWSKRYVPAEYPSATTTAE
ncbi:hypothetical protein B0T20DRAFT_480441 [Sordaria brevicollis]|uniref:Uncharacterized protein n=1 Tax=Sordaria brevicollis TaxID=83679 RepID=A0AAE0PBI3_SORBR|nr:hypothetical protein B0T20DRAFT_480441 [Sordaria brevicollis]